MTLVEKLERAGVKTAVLCGGPGGEREVSLASGENVHQALLRAGLRNELIVVPAEHPERALESVDCRVCVMMLHGEYGEDGSAQKVLERRGIAFTGSDSRACALAMDKHASKKLFVEKGIPTARWLVADDPAGAGELVREAGLSYPLFVKPNDRGSSVGVEKVETPAALAAAVAATLRESGLALVEEMVTGRELTVGWLDGRVLPIVELLADGVFYDYNAKYLSDATRYICPADLPPELAEEIAGHARAVAECLRARDLSRVDVMLGPEGPMVLESNALPGFTSHSLLPMAAAEAGIGMERLCLDLVAMAAQRAGIV